MGKAIREQLVEGFLEVTAAGTIAEFELPKLLAKYGKNLDQVDNDPAGFFNTLTPEEKASVVHGFVPNAFVQVRALARLTDKEGKQLPYNATTIAKAKTNIKNLSWYRIPKPSEGVKSKQQLLDKQWEQMEKAMEDNGLSADMIADLKNKFYS